MARGGVDYGNQSSLNDQNLDERLSPRPNTEVLAQLKSRSLIARQAHRLSQDKQSDGDVFKRLHSCILLC